MQIVRAVFSAASDRDGLRLRVDAVLNELGNRFERITLRQRDDADRIPPSESLQAIIAIEYNQLPRLASDARYPSRSRCSDRSLIGLPTRR
jgi:hypothetical protein